MERLNYHSKLVNHQCYNQEETIGANKLHSQKRTLLQKKTEILQESQNQTNSSKNDDFTEDLKTTRKRKPKWNVKEALSFDIDPKKWVKWINRTEAIPC